MIRREDHVGTVSEPRQVEVEAGFLKFFARVAGETDPVYFDEAAAKAAGHHSILMPPTYLFSLQMSHPARCGDLFDEVKGIGADIMSVLHGEQGFVHHRTICAGDRLTLTTITTDIYARKGRALEFVVQETRFENDAGELCAEARQVMVVRHG